MTSCSNDLYVGLEPVQYNLKTTAAYLFLVLIFTLITTSSIYMSSLCVHQSSHARQQSAVNEATNRVPRSESRCHARPETMASRWVANEGVECKKRETSVGWQGRNDV
jgi:hypothetical protein